MRLNVSSATGRTESETLASDSSFHKTAPMRQQAVTFLSLLVGETRCHLYFPPADLAGAFFPKQGF
jgi:hypothetical protein